LKKLTIKRKRERGKRSFRKRDSGQKKRSFREEKASRSKSRKSPGRSSQKEARRSGLVWVDQTDRGKPCLEKKKGSREREDRREARKTGRRGETTAPGKCSAPTRWKGKGVSKAMGAYQGGRILRPTSPSSRDTTTRLDRGGKEPESLTIGVF